MSQSPLNILRNQYPEILSITLDEIEQIAVDLKKKGEYEPEIILWLKDIHNDIRLSKQLRLNGWHSEENRFLSLPESMRFDIPQQVLDQIHGTLVKAYRWFGIGQWTLAELYFQGTLKLAFSWSNTVAARTAAANLAIMYLAADRYRDALQLCDQGLESIAVTSDVTMKRRMNTVKALCLLRTNRVTELVHAVNAEQLDNVVYDTVLEIYEAIQHPEASIQRWKSDWLKLKNLPAGGTRLETSRETAPESLQPLSPQIEKAARQPLPDTTGNPTRYTPGDIIDSTYQVVSALHGGMGEVYLCINEKNDYPVALKTFKPGVSSDPGFLKAFEKEVETWVALEKHPHIVQCYGVQYLDSRPFMVLELVLGPEGFGTDLRSWIDRNAIDFRTALTFAIQICRGLRHAKSKCPGIVHRDLKPDNILISSTRHAKITDFGLAKAVDTVISAGDPSRSNFVGTPLYMAPEQWLALPPDERTDIYAVGVILFEMLTGGVPYRADAFDNLKDLHCSAPIPKLPHTALPIKVSDIVQRCLAKRREGRYQTIEELETELSRAYHSTFGHELKHEDVGAYALHDYVHRGAAYRYLSQYDKAMFDLNQALQIDPECIEAMVERGQLYFTMGLVSEALQDLSRATTIDSEAFGAYGARGEIYRTIGRIDAAMDDFNKAIELYPFFPAFFNNRALALYAKGQISRALQDLDRAIELNPRYAKAYNNRANFIDSIDHNRALQDYSKAVELDPFYAKAYYNRGDTYLQLGRHLEALKDFDRAIELKPDYDKAITARERLGRALAEDFLEQGNAFMYQGWPDAAIERYTQAIEVSPKDLQAACFNNRGSAFFELKDYQRALRDVQEAIKVNPDFAEAYDTRANVYDALEEYDKAVQDYTQALELDNRSGSSDFVRSRTYFNRADTYKKMGRLHEALEDFAHVARLEPNDAAAHRNCGVICVQLQRYDEALMALNKAVELSPGTVPAHFYRGIALVQLEQYAEAIEDFSITIQLAPDFATAYSHRGIAFYGMGQIDCAFQDYSFALQIDPNHAMTHNNIGAALITLGEFERALIHFEKAAEQGHPLAAQGIDFCRRALQ